MAITRAILWALAIAFSWGCGRAPTEPATESVWDCWHVSTDLEILRDSKAAVLTLDLETGAATVQTSGQTWEARYSVEGLFRRWALCGGAKRFGQRESLRLPGARGRLDTPAYFALRTARVNPLEALCSRIWSGNPWQRSPES